MNTTNLGTEVNVVKQTKQAKQNIFHSGQIVKIPSCLASLRVRILIWKHVLTPSLYLF